MPTQNVSDATILSDNSIKKVTKPGLADQVVLLDNLKDVVDGTRGSIVTDGTEQLLFQDDPLGPDNLVWNFTKLVVKNMVLGDQILLRIYDWDIVDGAYYIADTVPLNDSQPKPDYFYPQFPAHKFKVTIQRVAVGAGGDKSYDWERQTKTWTW